MWTYEITRMDVTDTTTNIDVVFSNSNGGYNLPKTYEIQSVLSRLEVIEYVDARLLEPYEIMSSLRYLTGASVETINARQRARLQGINNETYVYYCNGLGNEHYPNCSTMYCFPLKEKMVAEINENDEVVYSGSGAFCLEVNIDQAEYTDMPTIHVNRLVDRETMELNGWFANEQS